MLVLRRRVGSIGRGILILFGWKSAASMRRKQLITYKELGELMRNLPTDETWLPLFLGRLKEKEPEIYRRMMEQAEAKLKEDK